MKLTWGDKVLWDNNILKGVARFQNSLSAQRVRSAQDSNEWINALKESREFLTQDFEDAINAVTGRAKALDYWPYKRAVAIQASVVGKLLSEMYLNMEPVHRNTIAFQRGLKTSFDDGMNSPYAFFQNCVYECSSEGNFVGVIHPRSLSSMYPMYIEQLAVKDTLLTKQETGWMFENGGRPYPETRLLFVKYGHEIQQLHLQGLRGTRLQTVTAKPTYKTLASAIAKGLAIEKILTVFFANYQHLPYLLSDQKIAPDKRKTKVFYDFLKFFRKKGLPPYLAGGLTPEMPADLQYLMELINSGVEVRNEIAAFFGIPPMLLGYNAKEGNGREVIEKVRINFSYGLEPILDEWLEAFNLRFAYGDEKWNAPRYKYLLSLENMADAIKSLNAQPGQYSSIMGEQGIRETYGIPEEYGPTAEELARLAQASQSNTMGGGE